MNNLFFIGGIGHPSKFGGELTKNKFLLRHLKPYFKKLFIIDTHKIRNTPWKLLKLLLIFIYPKTPIIFSTSYNNVKSINHICQIIFPKRKIVLWAIGGNLPERIIDGHYNIHQFKNLSAILVEGKSIASKLSDLGLTTAKYVPNFKDISYVPDISSKATEHITKFHFVFFSRIIPEKGVDDIITAAQNLNNSGYSDLFDIDFYGPIEQGYRCDFLNSISKVSNLKYCSYLDFSQKAGYDTLSKYHLTLFPTYWAGEGFPGVIIDSFIAGVPILATKWNLNGEIITKNTGFLIDPHSPLQIENILQKIITKEIILTPMYKKVQEYSKQFDCTAIINAHLLKNIGLLTD